MTRWGIRGSSPCVQNNGNAPANGEFFRVEGGEVHEVAVGPSPCRHH